jgi:subtilisin family serine protease
MSTSDIEDTVAAIGYAKVIVTLKPAPAAAGAAALLQTDDGIGDHFMIPSEAQAETLAMSARASASRKSKLVGSSASRRVRVYRHLGLAIGYVDAGGLAALEADPQIGKVVHAPELSLIRPVETQAAKLSSGTSWGVRRLKADRLWAAGFTGKGVVVGHLDTGVDGSHPALNGAIGAFAEFDMAGDKVANAQASDSGEHGTHTAGIIAGRSGLKGSFGMAPDARLASAMVIEGGQVVDRILAGLDWMIAEGVRIMSMSLGLRGFTPAFQAVIDALCAANVLPIIAIGNEGPNTSRSPGNYANALSVGAIDEHDQIPDFSGSQQFDRPDNALTPDLVAPGAAILSCVPGGAYKIMDGTSMATPHVAGLAALLLSAEKNATAIQLKQAILDSCALPAGVLQARGNRGVPDAEKAFAALTGSPLPQAAAAAMPTARRAPPPGARAAPTARVRAAKDTTTRTKVATSRGKKTVSSKRK